MTNEISKATLPALAQRTVPVDDIFMFRNYDRESGKYIGTTLVVRGAGQQVRIDDLTPYEIGQFAKMGVQKLC